MSMIFSPETEEQAADIVRDHAGRGTPLTICGGNTRAGFGNAVQADAALTSRALTGITAYNPAEMVVTAKAGTPVADIKAALAENGQMLAFEPADHRGVMGTMGEPTIGGVFAANVSGPRRFVSGAARDSLLGIRFVNGRGEAIANGGRVMKNVTGLDLVKLLAGSHGTLGFLTEVTFRVLPRPQATQTIVLCGLNDAEAAHAMAAALSLPVEVSGAAHLPESVKGRFAGGSLADGAATVLRLEGLPASVSLRAEKLQEAMRPYGPVARLDEDISRRLWQEVRDAPPYADGTQKPLWRVSVAPTAGHQLVAALRLQTGVDAFYDWQGGLVWMRMEAEPEAEMLRGFMKALGGGHATLLRASDAARAATPAFEPPDPGVATLSMRVKAALDPQGIFNPGKMGF